MTSRRLHKSSRKLHESSGNHIEKNVLDCLYSLFTKGFPGVSDSKESTCNVGDLGWIPELGRSPGGGHGNPLQYSCL